MRSWSKTQKVPTLLFNWPAKSQILHNPHGQVLIIGPWNYPLQLLLAPLAGAIAAGNCVVLKPSELVPITGQLIKVLIHRYFPKEHITTILADAKGSEKLLEHDFDYIFFTGSRETGEKVYKAAASKMIPLTLELGGKNPCFVDKGINLDIAAQRIVWGKFFNAGQTCIAPDYLVVDKSIKSDLVERIKKILISFYGENPKISKDYGRIKVPAHFNYLVNILENSRILFGGDTISSEGYIAPTIIEVQSWNDQAMKREIFGPLLPVIEVEDIDESVETVSGRDNPLAVYVFSKNSKLTNKIISTIKCGSVCINGTFSQLISHSLPFGGAGKSGFGRYRGKYSFETFSNKISVMNRSIIIDIKAAYPPYKISLDILRRISRIFFSYFFLFYYVGLWG